MSVPIIRRASVTASIPMGTQPILSQSPPGWGSQNSQQQSFSSRSRNNSSGPFIQQGKALAPFPLESSVIKILLLENVNTAAVKMLQGQGYEVVEVKSALGEDEVIKRLNDGNFQAVGVRSKTKITARVISECPSVSIQLFGEIEIKKLILEIDFSFSWLDVSVLEPIKLIY